jgi:asparagine synthase (glutamine-hydrolysing)
VAGNRLAFASELRPLLALIPREVDRENLATLLRLRFSPSPDTLFKGVHKLRPGCLLEISLDGDQLVASEKSYMEPVRGAAGAPVSYREAVDHYGRLFEQAVERQLMSDVEVGVLLSGGVDSALVASAAQRHSSRPLKAFTIGFTGAGAAGVDEVDDAIQTADHLGMDHRTVRMAFPDFLGTLRQCLRAVEEPLATTSIVPMYYLARLASQDVKVVLSGQGADELMGGYTRYQGELYRNVVPKWLARSAGTLAQGLGVRSEQLTRGLKALGTDGDVARFLTVYEVFSREDVSRLLGSAWQDQALARVEDAYSMLGCASLRTGIERMMSLDLRFGLSDDLLLYTDKLTMHYSLECRVPMLDHDLVRYVESLPPEYRVTRRARKRIHKDFATRSLTPLIIGRPKKGFLSPTREWFRDGDTLREVLMDRGSHFASYFDLREVEATILQHSQGFNRERHIFLLLCLCFFLEEFA